MIPPRFIQSWGWIELSTDCPPVVDQSRPAVDQSRGPWMNPPPGSLQSEVGRSDVSWIGVAATGLIHRVDPSRAAEAEWVNQSPGGGLIHVRSWIGLIQAPGSSVQGRTAGRFSRDDPRTPTNHSFTRRWKWNPHPCRVCRVRVMRGGRRAGSLNLD